MVSAYGKQISIPAEYNDLQLWIGQLESCCKRDRPAVGGVVSIEIEVSRCTPGATNTGHDNGHFSIELTFLQCCHKGGKSNTDSAPRAPDVGDTAVL